MVLRTGPINIGFSEKHFAVQFVGDRYQVFDEDEQKVI
jgi:hypothetical protein